MNLWYQHKKQLPIIPGHSHKRKFTQNVTKKFLSSLTFFLSQQNSVWVLWMVAFSLSTIRFLCSFIFRMKWLNNRLLSVFSLCSFSFGIKFEASWKSIASVHESCSRCECGFQICRRIKKNPKNQSMRSCLELIRSMHNKISNRLKASFGFSV